MSEEQKRKDGARTKAATAGTVQGDNIRIGGDWKFQKNPPFLKERLSVWDSLFEKQTKVYEGFPHEAIKVTMPDGAEKEGVSFQTSPYDIAAKISKQFADKLVVAKVKYTKRVATLDEGLLNPEAEEGKSEEDQWYFWDVNRVLEGDCQLVLYKFDDAEGKETFWHSSAHVLGETLENEYGVHLCHGPPTDSGFFYDTYSGKDIFTEKNYKEIEKAAQKIVSEKQTFSRLVLTKEEALELFGLNPFKVQLITSKIPDGGKVTAYRCGNLIDLCTGPHIPSTKIIKAFKIMKNSSAYWLGKAGNDSLQRVYGVTFPSKKEMDEYVHLIEEAAKRDHRTIGRAQDLFDMNPLSPGCGFMYPKGTQIYNQLTELIREQYRVRGYSEVISPNIFNLKLWKTSGHYANYKDNMFVTKIENQGFGMKPMNCPAHCLMFANVQRTYRELPIRYADFGVLHRNELSGALSGLTRVRRFCQDDAHHFCDPSQILDEVMTVLDFLEHVYGLFGFKFELELSTRPEKRLGDEDLWDKAEAALEAALNKFGKPWKLNPGDGAFYGPKIDVKVYDALKRAHQCGTVQLDFQLPIRFNLQFKTDAKCEAVQPDDKKVMNSQMFKADENDDEDFEWKEQPLKPGFARPVIIHRAVLGSIERFMAILIEHLGGKWPFFLSPRQAIICPISEKFAGYCESVYLYLHKQGYAVELDTSNLTLNKKIRNHQLEQWNFILVAGEDEAKTGMVDIRTRDNERMGKMRIDQLHQHFQTLLPGKSNEYEKFYEKAWDPSVFGTSTCGDSGAKGGMEKCTLYSPSEFDSASLLVRTVADIAGAQLDINSDKDKLKTLSEKNPCNAPYLETKGGDIIFSRLAISTHIARMNPGCGLLGSSPFEEAKVNEWMAWCSSSFLPHVKEAVYPILGQGGKVDTKKFNEGVKQAKEHAKVLDTYLKGKQYLVGSKITLADLYLANSMTLSFQTIFDAGFRKAMPNMAKWFETITATPSFVKRFGIIKACAKALKPFDGSAAPAKKAAAKADDDDLDLFGDDDGDDGEAAKKIAAAAKAKGTKKPKKVVIAQSLVMFEVKPLDSDTDLDKLAARILAIKMDGLYWKTEYKKLPVAFGIFKLIIAVTVEDEKVSVDGLQEKIEEFEDMVQSVEILAFNKI